jgi:putative nucleotidyltransferase with HDIG domain
MNSKPHLVLIPIDSFIGGHKAHVDLYLKIGERFLKVVNKGEVFDLNRLRNYQDHKVDHIYVEQSAFSGHVETALSVAGVISVRSNLPQEAKVRVLTNTAELVLSELQTMQLNAKVFAHAKSVCDSMMSILNNENGVGKILQDLSSIDEDFAKHSIGVGFISVMLAHSLKWRNNKTVATISLGGLLHDIGYKELPPLLLKLKRSDMTPDDVTQYQTHPQRGMDILRDFKEIPKEVAAIVGEHHEIPSGTGFPRGLKTDRIYPLARCVSLSDILCHMILKTSRNPAPMTIREAVTYLSHSMGHDYPPFFWEALRRITMHPSPQKDGAADVEAPKTDTKKAA